MAHLEGTTPLLSHRLAGIISAGLFVVSSETRLHLEPHFKDGAPLPLLPSPSSLDRRSWQVTLAPLTCQGQSLPGGFEIGQAQ